MVSSSYRSGTTRFLTRVRGVSPSLNRILQTVSARHTLMRLMSFALIAALRDHSRNFWSPADAARPTGRACSASPADLTGGRGGGHHQESDNQRRWAGCAN